MGDQQQSVTETHKYFTTTLPYVNADPHIGFALEAVQADALARFKRLEGFPVFFNMGTDEHGQKVWQKAQEENEDVQDYVDRHAQQFSRLGKKLNLSYDNFVRTTDDYHIASAQEFWRRCEDNGDIYKKKYKGLYCVGCEMFVTKKDLTEDGFCPDHPSKEPIELEEENYFFRFSDYQEDLLQLYEDNPELVVPDFRFNEIKQFVSDGLEDFSISRVAEKMPWGVPVPGDDSQVMYVWFDALVNYVSTLGWPEDEENFQQFWPVTQFAGKDQLRQQAAMWQAMLMSAGLSPSQQIVIHGFINVEGQKMSKSIGNVISPFDLVDEYDTDTLRYYLLRHVHPVEDSNFTAEKLKEDYNANLANGLGNLVSRIMKMYIDYEVEVAIDSDQKTAIPEEDMETLQQHMNRYRFDKAMDYIWAELSHLDAYITDSEPYKKIKSDDEDEVEEAKRAVAYLVIRLYDLAIMLLPFLPETSEEIQRIIEEKEMPEPLFSRKE